MMKQFLINQQIKYFLASEIKAVFVVNYIGLYIEETRSHTQPFWI